MLEEILDRIRPRITKQTAKFREPIEPGLSLAIILWFLATGDSYASLTLLSPLLHHQQDSQQDMRGNYHRVRG